MSDFPVLHPSEFSKTDPRLLAELDMMTLGSCGKDVNWRDILFQALSNHGVDLRLVVDPNDAQYDRDLSPALEKILKQLVKRFFVAITGDTRATVSLTEAAFLMLTGARVNLYIEPIQPGLVIKGQAITDEEAASLNLSRQYVLDLARVLGYSQHDTLEAAIEVAAKDKLQTQRRRGLTSTQKSRAKQLVGQEPYNKPEWIEAHALVVIDDPIDALLQVLMAMTVALTRESVSDRVTIVVPNTERWIGRNTHKITIVGRAAEDYERFATPYLVDQLAQLGIDVLFV